MAVLLTDISGFHSFSGTVPAALIIQITNRLQLAVNFTSLPYTLVISFEQQDSLRNNLLRYLHYLDACALYGPLPMVSRILQLLLRTFILLPIDVFRDLVMYMHDDHPDDASPDTPEYSAPSAFFTRYRLSVS